MQPEFKNDLANKISETPERIKSLNPAVPPHRADEEAIENAVRKASSREGAMGAKTLCIPDVQDSVEGMSCFYSGNPARNFVLWGRSY